MPVDRRPLLVGELNPYGDDPDYALYPWPRNSAGHRLATRVMGLTAGAYLARFRRINLCTAVWRLSQARGTWDSEVVRSVPAVVVACGAKVCNAARVDFEPFTASEVTGFSGRKIPVVILPHSSGRSRLWNAPDAVARARAVLRAAGVLEEEESE